METQKTEAKDWYDHYHKIMLALPVIITIALVVYIGFFYAQHNDFIHRDVSLSGGTTITLNGGIETGDLESQIQKQFPDVSFRKLTDISTGKPVATIIESSATPEQLKPAIESILGYNLTDANSSVEFAGPTLSQGFYSQLIRAVFISFVLMALVIFYLFGESMFLKVLSTILSLAIVKLTFSDIFSISILVVVAGLGFFIYGLYLAKKRLNYIYLSAAALVLILSFIFQIYYLIIPIFLVLILIYLLTSIPSVAVISCAFADIVWPLAILDFFNVRISAAGIAAFLMLIGYSVDTDILLTTRAIKKQEGSLNLRILGAFKTGILMTSTALLAVLPAFFIVTGLPDSFRQIFLILAIGLGADIINTWLTNASLIKIYATKRGIK
jgi:preprotein translocase subunit SecF